MKSNNYSKVAIMLHWVIGLLIIGQIAGGFWMTDAIKDPLQQKAAIQTYQLHKSFGLCILFLSLVRLYWRATHSVPSFPNHVTKFEKFAARSVHLLFYFLIIAIPFSGWLMVSTSPLGYPTPFFGLFNWPALPIPFDYDKQIVSGVFKESHEFLAITTIVLLGLHVAGAIKHQFIYKDEVLSRMLPFLKK